MKYQKWNWQEVPEEIDELLTSDRQREVLALARAGHSTKSIVSATGTTASNINNIFHMIKKVGRKHGYDQTTGSELVVGNPHYVKGRSGYYNVDPETGDRKLVREWVKTDTDKVNQAHALKAFVDGLKDEIKPVKPTKAPKGVLDPDLASMIVIGDAHIGCYVYGPECKDRDFDTDIATREIRDAVDDLVERSPKAKTGILVDVGDFMHANTSHNTTWSGTPLDVDTRYHRIMKSAGLVMRYAIDSMLKKFDEVIVVVAKGNHNPDAAVGVQLMLSFYYEKEPRVNVLDTEGWFHYIEFGKWLLQMNHGDKVKPQKAVNCMARDMPEAWGRTTSRMCVAGHFHIERTMEFDGAVYRTFGALPPSDGWHSSMGYGSRSTMELVCLKKSGGVHSTLVHEIEKQFAKPDAVVA